MPIGTRKFLQFTDLWESGIHLDLAWLRHSPTVEPFDLAALRTHPDNDAGIRGNPRYAELGSWLPPTYELRQAKLKETIVGLRHYLLSLLYDGDLWAIGRLKCKSRSDAKVLIPREYFFYPREDGKALKTIDWQNALLTAEGKQFFEIRVALPLSVSQTSRGKPKPRGGSVMRESRSDSGEGDSSSAHQSITLV